MTVFATAPAFRAALEQRLKTTARQRSFTIVRLRKLVTFDRFLARLFAAAPDRWVLKGGVALDFRLQDRARATVDLDMAYLAGREQVNADVIAVVSTNLDDYFTFTAQRARVPTNQEDLAAQRLRLVLQLREQPLEGRNPFAQLLHGARRRGRVRDLLLDLLDLGVGSIIKILDLLLGEVGDRVVADGVKGGKLRGRGANGSS